MHQQYILCDCCFNECCYCELFRIISIKEPGLGQRSMIAALVEIPKAEWVAVHDVPNFDWSTDARMMMMVIIASLLLFYHLVER